jgi:RNA polymerase sigma-70 factor, ECF subfamily
MRGVLTYQPNLTMESERAVRILTDDHLVEHLQRDEARAFVQLYHRYKHRVYAYCYRLLRHPQNAEDAAQETFVKIYRSISQLENSASLQSWVFSIARNEAFTILRRTRPTEKLDEESESVWDDEGPLERMVQQERAEIVQRCLGMLRPVYRELLILKEYELLSYAEISKVTGATESAIKAGLFKARKAMGKKLELILNERNGQ